MGTRPSRDEGRDLRGLFRITTDRGAFCFAAQDGKVMLLQFNEEMFRAVVRQMLQLRSPTQETTG